MTLEAILQAAALCCGIIVIFIPFIVYSRQPIRFEVVDGQKPRPTSLRVPVVLMLTILYILIGIWLWIPIFTDLPEVWTTIFSIVVAFLYFPGIGLCLWGFIALGRQFAVSNIRTAILYPDQRLIQTGPYQ